MTNMWILGAAAVADETDTSSEQVITSTSITDAEGQAVQESVTQAEGSPAPQAQEQAQKQSLGLMSYLPLVAIFVIMYLMLFRGPRKKQKEHTKMVQSLEKNAKIRTIGGILGTVIDVKDDIITLKVDESNNTKIKITSGSVSKVMSEDN